MVGVPRGAGRAAAAIGAAVIVSEVSIVTYFTIGEPFGTINDLGNATIGVLSAVLAWQLRRQVPGRLGVLASGAAYAGAAVAVAGSALVISRATTFFLAGLVSSAGFAGIGLWLAVLGRSGSDATGWPGRLRTLGVVTGALICIGGVLSAPGILLGLDDAATAPSWAWLAFIGWLGIYVTYPVWAVWLSMLSRAGGPSRSSREALSDRSATHVRG